MRYFLELAYNGLDFHGWQSQPNAVSVQSTIEEALSKVLATETPIVGAGRTDTGVNARQIYAHFDSESDLENDSKFLSSLNSLVGREIAVNKIFRVKAVEQLLSCDNLSVVNINVAAFGSRYVNVCCSNKYSVLLCCINSLRCTVFIDN